MVYQHNYGLFLPNNYIAEQLEVCGEKLTQQFLQRRYIISFLLLDRSPAIVNLSLPIATAPSNVFSKEATASLSL
jgi:hypothetical protein